MKLHIHMPHLMCFESLQHSRKALAVYCLGGYLKCLFKVFITPNTHIHYTILFVASPTQKNWKLHKKEIDMGKEAD